jgi:hypothetical protein
VTPIPPSAPRFVDSTLAAALTRDDIGEMLATARARLAETPPVTVTLGRFLYSSEGIALAVSQHLTVCYSTDEQPAGPAVLLVCPLTQQVRSWM